MTKMVPLLDRSQHHGVTDEEKFLTYSKDAETTAEKLVAGFEWMASKNGTKFWAQVYSALIAEARHFRDKHNDARNKRRAREAELRDTPRLSHYFMDGESSMIRAIVWHASHLIVVFLNGQQYEYQGVPKPVFDAFAKAKSPGKFFNKNIKGQYV